MVHTPQLTRSSSPLGRWVTDFFVRLFAQPDDELSASTVNEFVAEGFTARHNHELFSRERFIESVAKFREHGTTTIHDVKELQVWEEPDGSDTGCVSQLLYYTDINKETGDRTELSTLLTASVKVINGKKVLADLTEVMNILE